MTLREKIEVMEAFERGEEIEHRDRLNNMWFASNFPAWNWKEFEYRIKPKPKKVVVIEKWLCKNITWDTYFVFEASKEHLEATKIMSKVKLLDTYEVEI